MGCDIHAYAEKKDFSGYWYCVENFQLSRYYISELRKGNPLDGVSQFSISPLYYGRNYSCFEALAGVRGKDYNRLFEIKGIPDDVTEFVKEEYEKDSGWHTPSYVTIGELFDEEVESKKTYYQIGYITKDNAENLPLMTNDEKMNLVYFNQPDGIFTERAEWSYDYDPLDKFKSTYFESFKRENYLSYCTDAEVLERILADGDSYRIVFWFDN